MNVLIIGGGASGMAAALTAARQGHQVVLAERQARQLLQVSPKAAAFSARGPRVPSMFLG